MAEADSLGKDLPLGWTHKSVTAFKKFVSNNPNLVEVQGLEGKDGSLLTDELLQLFFESSRYAGGGKIEKMYVSNVKKAALLTFSDEKVAQGLIGAHYMHFNMRILTVTLPTPSMCDIKAMGILVQDFAPLKTIQPGGCVQQLKELLLSWFSSVAYRTEKSPRVVDCYIYPETNEAFVTFEDFIDPLHVMQAKGAEGIVIDEKVIGTLSGPYYIPRAIQKRLNMAMSMQESMVDTGFGLGPIMQTSASSDDTKTDRGNYGIEETQKLHPVYPDDLLGENIVPEEKLRKSQSSLVPQKRDENNQLLDFWQEKLPNGTVVVIYTADIINVKVDVIVKAANGTMIHADGITEAIARAAGYSLDKECQEVVRYRGGEIPVTQNIVTTGGKLCRKIIHAVGPKASEFESDNWKPILVSTFLNALIEAGTLQSIAILAVSSGDYGDSQMPPMHQIPVQVVANALKEAVCTFDRDSAKQDKPKIIHLVNILPETTHQIIQAFQRNDLNKTKSLTGSPDSTGVDSRQQIESIGSYPARHRRGQRAQATSGNDYTDNKEVIVTSEPYATNAGSDFGQYSKGDSQITRSYSDSYGTDTKQKGNSDGSSVGFFERSRKFIQSTIGNVSPMGSRKSGDNKNNDSLSILRRESTDLRQFYNVQCGKEVPKDHVSEENKLREYMFNLLREIEKYIQKEQITRAEVCLEIAKKKAMEWQNYSLQKSRGNNTNSSNATNKESKSNYMRRDQMAAFKMATEPEETMDTNENDFYDSSYEIIGKERDLPLASEFISDDENDTDVQGAVGKKSNSAKKTREECCICLEEATDQKQLEKCKHIFCRECIDESFTKCGPKCPLCGTMYGKMKGTQPDSGKMAFVKTKGPLPGYQDCGTIVITYNIPNGLQKAEHPNPGKRYTGTSRTAYLPDNIDGNRVLKLLQQAFEARLVFTVGQSVTSGQKNTVVWNNIHHKTAKTGGPQNYGYPDPNYLNRVLAELAAFGIK